MRLVVLCSCLLSGCVLTPRLGVRATLAGDTPAAELVVGTGWGGEFPGDSAGTFDFELNPGLQFGDQVRGTLGVGGGAMYHTMPELEGRSLRTGLVGQFTLVQGAPDHVRALAVATPMWAFAGDEQIFENGSFGAETTRNLTVHRIGLELGIGVDWEQATGTGWALSVGAMYEPFTGIALIAE